MNPELVFFLCPVSAILWMAGGTWNKTIRRLGIPLLTMGVVTLFLGWSWWWLLLALFQHIAFRLPFTLVGNGVWDDPWANFSWIWASGYLQGLPCLVIASQTGLWGIAFTACLIPCVTLGAWGTVSNFDPISGAAPWKWVEGVVGMAVSYPPAMLISSYLS